MNLMAGGDQVPRHVASHDAQPDEPQFHAAAPVLFHDSMEPDRSANE